MQASLWLLLGWIVQITTVTQLHRVFSYHNQIHEQVRRDEEAWGLPPRLDYGADASPFTGAFCFFEGGGDATGATHCGKD